MAFVVKDAVREPLYAIHHLKRDYQGLYQLHDDGSEAFIKLRDGMRRIAFERNEDANEI